MVCKCFRFILEAFPKCQKWFSMHSCMQILNCLFCTAAILRDAPAVFSTIDAHPFGAPDHSPSANNFHNDWCFFKASVPAIIWVCEQFGFNFLELNAFKHHTNYYFQTIMEKIKYKLSEIQNLKMQEQKKANNICYFKTTGNKSPA